MANRTWHVTGGFITYVIILLWLYYANSFIFQVTDIAWLIEALFLALFGAEFPDLDKLEIFEGHIDHRDWFFHSSIIVTIITATMIWTHPSYNVLLPLMGFFSMGLGSHLLLDLFPTYKKSDTPLGKIKSLILWFISGLSGDAKDPYHFGGTYTIHFSFVMIGKKSISVRATRLWLFINSLISIFMGAILIQTFIYTRTVL